MYINRNILHYLKTPYNTTCVYSAVVGQEDDNMKVKIITLLIIVLGAIISL